MKRFKRLMIDQWAMVVLVFSFVIGCVTNPETGRRQLLLVPESQMTQLGLDSFNQMKQEVPISKDAGANEMVQRVGKRIASVVSLPNAQWEFVVFDSKEANAFCLPGGKIGVYTGILPITKDDAGLATVLGHEVAHATLQHGRERMSEAMVMQGIGEVGGASLSSSDPKVQGAVMTVYGLGTQLGRTLPHSRSQESEADHRGLIYMAKAGYEPAAAVEFWQRFTEYGAKAGGSPPKFLSTHPPSAERVQNLKKWVPEAKAEAQRQQTTR
jgi:predicted Zn-dependent protease